MLVAAGPDFTISTANTDPEIATTTARSWWCR